MNFIKQIKQMIKQQYPDFSLSQQKLKLLETIKDQYFEEDDNKSDESMHFGSFSILAGESQDPNDTLSDLELRESFIDLSQQKQNKDKGKRCQK